MAAVAVTSANSNSLLNSARATFRAIVPYNSTIGSGFNVSGITYPSIAKLSSTRIVVANDAANTLRTYDFNGSTWSEVGNSRSINFALPSITALSSTRICLLNPNGSILQAYDFDGTDWNAVGSSFSLTAIDTISGITSLSSTSVALADSANDKLVTYTFNGSTWSQTGNALTITGLSSCSITSLTSTRVAIAHNSTSRIRAYDWNGTDWSQVGSAATGSSSTPSISKISSTQILMSVYGTSEQYQYSFDGAAWILDFTLNIPVGATAYTSIAFLESGKLVFIEENTDTIQAYLFGKAGIPFVLSFYGTTIQVFKGDSTTPTSWTAYSLSAAGTILAGVSGAIDSGNIIHISWLDDVAAVSKLKYCTFNCNTNTFSAIITINNDIGGDPVDTSLYTAIAVDSNNIPHIACTLYPSVSGGLTYTVAYYNRVSGAWSALVNVYRVKNINCTLVQIAIDLDNLPYVAIQRSGATYVYLGNANNTTSFTEYAANVAAPSGLSSAVDKYGNHWFGRTSAALLISKHTRGDAWSSWSGRAFSTTATSISIVPVGDLIYVFYENSNNEIALLIHNITENTWSAETVLETGTFNSVKANWAFWVDNDSLGSLNSQNNQLTHFTNSSFGALYGIGTLNAYEKQGIQINTNTRGGKYDNIRLAINKAGAPTDSLIVKVYSGSFEGTLIATSNSISGSPLTTTSQFVDFQFDSEFTLEGSTTYYIIIERTGTYDATNCYYVNGTSAESNTNNARYRRSSGTWTVVSAGYDTMIFFAKATPIAVDYIFMDETATPDIWWNILSLAAPTIWITKLLKWYNGASWVEKPLKSYIGGSWVTKIVKRNM